MCRRSQVEREGIRVPTETCPTFRSTHPEEYCVEKLTEPNSVHCNELTAPERLPGGCYGHGMKVGTGHGFYPEGVLSRGKQNTGLCHSRWTVLDAGAAGPSQNPARAMLLLPFNRWGN